MSSHLVKKRFKAVLFDMDGVVIDSMKYHAESWVRIFSQLGLKVTENDIFLKEGIKPSELITETFKEFGHHSLSETEIVDILEKKVKYFWGKYHPLPYPEAIDCFNELEKLDYRMAIVSGSTRLSVETVMENFSLSRYFEVIIHSDLISIGKPHPMSYLTAMEKLHLEPEECLCIENAPYGIRSARSAGIFTAALTTTLEEDILYEAGANLVIHSHKQIREILSWDN